LNYLVSWLGDWRENEPRVRQAVKTTIAACLAYLIADFLALPQAFWAAVVAIFVTQASVGASLGQALDWFLGSIIGAFVGAVVAILVGHRSDVLLIVGLAGTVLVMAYFAARRVQMRIACVNAAIIILGSQPDVSPIQSAGVRVLEVVIGTLVAVAVMLIVFPSRAGPALAAHIAQTLPLYFRLLSDLLAAALAGRYDERAIIAASGEIRTAIAKNEALRAQIQTEVAGFVADSADPEALLTALRRLWHTELMLARVVRSPLPAQARAELRGGIEELRDAVEALQAQVGTSGAAAKGALHDVAAVEAAIAKLNASIVTMCAPEAHALPMQDVMRLMTFDFALEQLRQNLKDLANRSKELAMFTGSRSWTRKSRGPSQA